MDERTHQGVEFARRKSPDGIIDCWVNGNPPGYAEARWQRVEYLFGGSRTAAGETADQLIESMDQHGIARALLAMPGPPKWAPDLWDAEDGRRWALDAVQRYPDRFRLTVTVDPHQGMAALRRLDSLVRNDGAALLRLVPFLVGLPPNDRVYFPLYARCIDLNIPVTLNVGISGPRVPSMMQHPQYLDEVCAFWPDLTIVSTHAGEPWTDLLVKLMAKWPNLYHMISAFAPRYYPEELIAFLNSSRGRHKVMFASDYPVMSFQRCLAELPGLSLKDDAWPAFLFDNAERVFWQRPAAEPGERGR